MSKQLRVVAGLSVWMLACVSILGCGGGGEGSTVSGTIMVDGKAPTISADQQVHLRFSAPERSVAAGVTPDGRFSVELPPGKYLVTLKIVDKQGTDTLGGKFDDANAKMEQEITGSVSDLVLDFK